MFGLGLPEIVVIVLVVAVLFFGSGKITEFAKSLGRATGEFKKGKRAVEAELKDITNEESVQETHTVSATKENTNNNGQDQR